MVAPVHRYDDIRVFRKEAVTLAAAGHEVILYARTPDGEPLVRDGVQVHPVRYRNRLGRFARQPQLGHRIFREHADVYHVHNPDMLPIGFALKLRGGRVVYDTHEDFRTEILLRQWVPAVLRTPAAAAVTALERLAGRWLDAVIVTQPQLLDRIPQAVVIGNPPLVDPDCARAAAVRRAARWQLAGADEPLVLGYVGGLSEDRGLLWMVDLVDALQESGPARLLLIGPQVNDDALDRARTMPGWRFVDHAGELPQEEAFEQLADADLGLILFSDVASHRHIDPNKIYEYLALALPFVATAFPGWVERFAGVHVGLFTPTDEPVAALAGRVRRFVSDRASLARASRRAVEFVTTSYSWQAHGAPLLLGLYERLAPAPTGFVPARAPRSRHNGSAEQ